MPLMPPIVLGTLGGLKGHSRGRRRCCMPPESMQHPGCSINSLLNCAFVKRLKAKDNSQNSQLSGNPIREGNLYSWMLVSGVVIQLLACTIPSALLMADSCSSSRSQPKYHHLRSQELFSGLSVTPPRPFPSQQLPQSAVSVSVFTDYHLHQN